MAIRYMEVGGVSELVVFVQGPMEAKDSLNPGTLLALEALSLCVGCSAGALTVGL
jgi:hypothetical protein